MQLKRTEPGSVYEDASTVDPSALNEALTGTRPSDLENVDVDAAYDVPAPVTDVTGVAEHSVPDPGYQTNPPGVPPYPATGGIDPGAVPPDTEATWSTEKPAAEDSTTVEDSTVDPAAESGTTAESGTWSGTTVSGSEDAGRHSVADEEPAPIVPGETPPGHPDVPGDTPSNENPDA